MKYFILKLLGFKRCILCAKYKYKGKTIRCNDDGEIDYFAFICKQCLREYRED